MVWLLLIVMISSALGVLVSVGEVFVSLLLIIESSLQDVAGKRVAGTVMLLVVMGGMGIGFHYLLVDGPDSARGTTPSTFDPPLAAQPTANERGRHARPRRLTTRCGTGTSPDGFDTEVWRTFRCEAHRDAECIAWSQYTTIPQQGCPGAQLCCPPAGFTAGVVIDAEEAP